MIWLFLILFFPSLALAQITKPSQIDLQNNHSDLGKVSTLNCDGTTTTCTATGTTGTISASGGGGSSQWTGTNPIYFNGNVGINTATPQANLHIGESANAIQFRVDNPGRYQIPEIKDSNNTALVFPPMAGNFNTTDNYEIGQLITVTSPIYITGVGVVLINSGFAGSPSISPTGNLNVSIQTVAGGFPTGTLLNANLSNASYTPPSAVTGPTNIIPFTGATLVNPGTYAIVVYPNITQTGVSGGFQGWITQGDNTGSYVGGLLSNDNGSWAAVSGNDLIFSVYGYSTSTIQPNPFVVDNNGNVGINTTSPINPLQIYFPTTGDYFSWGETNFNLQGLESVTVPTLSPYWSNGKNQTGAMHGGLYILGDDNSGAYNGPELTLLSYTGNTLSIFDLGDYADFGGSIDSGNLWYKSNINHSPTMEVLSDVSLNNTLILGNGSNFLSPATADGVSTLQVLGLTTTDNLHVTTNVGIGTTLPIGALDVEGTINPVVFYGNTSGNVGIGSIAPGQKLDVQGTIRAISGGTCTTLYQCNGGVDVGVIQTATCSLCPAGTCIAMNGCF